jgi:hypothetical protein
MDCPAIEMRSGRRMGISLHSQLLHDQPDSAEAPEEEKLYAASGGIYTVWQVLRES